MAARLQGATQMPTSSEASMYVRGVLVLETKSKYGAFCEEVKGLRIQAGME